MPRGRRRTNRDESEEKRDPHEILHNLIQKARNLTDKDIWNHSLGAKRKNKPKRRATEQEEDEELLHEADLSATKYFHLETQPSLITNGQLRDYQIEGVSWLINLRNNGLHGILADEMGLGKTLQCIALLAHLRQCENINGVHLIVVPKSTIINWCREFKKWCPCFNVLALEAANKEERRQLIKQNFRPTAKMDVVICSYEICMIEKTVLKKIPFEYIIVDEAHRLKNNASKFSRILRHEFQSENRLLVTGTPLQNNLRELWSLLNFLLPALFASALDFDAMFDFGNSDDEQSKIFQQLRVLLAPFLLRRLKVNVTKDLPPKTELIIFVGMTELQKDVYKKVLLKEMSVFQAADSPKRGLLNLVMQLRKCANHPYLFDGVEDMSLHPFGQHLIANSGKLLLLDKLLRKLYNAGSRVLIFSQMTRVLDILEDYCAMTKYKYCRIDGSVSGEDRQTAMDAFNAEQSELFLFLLTTRAGGLGINLQSADIVIIFDSDWNPQMDLQAMDRAHRIGQTKPVFVYRLVTKDTVEQRILERAELKLRLDAMVIQKHRKSNAASNNKQDLMEMIQYGADKIFKSKGSSITDEDIDAILSASVTETAKLKEKWQTNTKKEFSELTLEFNYQQYEGMDYTQRRKERNKQLNEARYRLLETMNKEFGENGHKKSTRLATQFGGKRRKNYNEDAYYREKLEEARDAINANKNIDYNNKNGLAQPSRLPDIRYWQLYDVKALYTINAKEWDFFNKYKNAHYYDAAKHVALTAEEIAFKGEILENGFGAISYRDFGCFVRSVIKYGKDDIAAICEAMTEVMDVGNDGMITKYHRVFFAKAAGIEELESAVLRIDEGEEKRKLRAERLKEREQRVKEKLLRKELWVKRKEEMAAKRELRRKEISERNEKRMLEAATKREERQRIMEQRMKEQRDKYKVVLNSRMAKHANLVKNFHGNIYKELQIPDAKCFESGFSKEMDRYLFLITYEVGYGHWKEIYSKLVKHPYFKFNFLLQTLGPIQMKNRMDSILRACVSSKSSHKSSRNKRNSCEASLDIKAKKNKNGLVDQPPIKKRKIDATI